MLATSKSIQANTELTLLAPLKGGLSPKAIGFPTDLSYPTRLSMLLTSLFGDRKRELERDRIVEGLLEELQVIRSVQWVIIGQAEPQLMLAVTFDGPWEPYIRTIVDRGGPLLDLIFSHCEGFEGHTCADGFQKFAGWVRSRQIKTEFLYGAASDLTTDDVRYLKQFEETFAQGIDQPSLVSLASRSSLAPLKRARSPRWFAKVLGLAALRGLFSDEELKFDRLAALVLLPEFGVLDPAGEPEENQRFNGLRNGGGPPAQAMAWFEQLARATAAAGAAAADAVPLAPVVEARTEVQGSILTPFGDTTHGCVALVRFRGKASAAEFLRLAREALATEPAEPADAVDAGSPLVNLALTFRGLRSIGLDAQILESFPKEFQEGLEQRAGMLGDIGRNHPLNWSLPSLNWPDAAGHEGDGEHVELKLVDAVLLMQIASKAETHELLPVFAQVLERFAAVSDVLHVQPTRRYSASGHFGLLDGISQPAARGDRSAGSALARDQVPLGDLLLGYPNERDRVSNFQPGQASQLFKNATFMALRKMSQDVEAYRTLGPNNELALGRRANGTALEQESLPEAARQKLNANEFDYPANEAESRCPHFAHARRANPRSQPQPPPRILRRGMSYGPLFDDDRKAARGVVFIALAASLAEQYEVVQRWVNAGNSTGVLSSHPDLIAGPFPEGSERHLYFSNALGDGKIPLPKKQLSVLDWGLYGFMPARGAIEWLEDVARSPVAEPALAVASVAPSVDAGAPPNAVATPPRQFGAHALEPNSPAMKMKVFLEGGNSTPEVAAYWRGVQAEGVRSTPFAVLVASQEAVQDVLLDPEKFSVRSYWARMNACKANSYLGMDPAPQPLQGDTYADEVKPGDYARESRAANDFVRSIGREEAFQPALRAGRAWLGEQRPLPGQGPKVLNLAAFGRRVIRDVGTELFGLPKDFLSDGDNFTPAARQVRCPFDLTTAFVHIFPPRPSAAVSAQAVEAGGQVYAAAQQAFDALSESKFIQALRAAGGHGSETQQQQRERELRTLLGVLSGFAVPTNGHLMSVLVQLVISGELWSLQRELGQVLLQLQRDSKAAGVSSPPLSVRHAQFLYEPLYGCMIRAAVPERIHRTALSAATIGAKDGVGGVAVKPGDLIAVSIAAAAEEAARNGSGEPWRLLFGDLPSKAAEERAPQTPVHACPAQDVAIGVLLGALVALLEYGELRRTDDPDDVFQLLG